MHIELGAAFICARKIFYTIIDSAGIYYDECKSFIQLPKPISCDIPIDDIVKELVDVTAPK